MSRSDFKFTDTLLIHGDREMNATSAVAPPIFQTANFHADSADDFSRRASETRHPRYYTRFGNPTLAQAERIIADLEHAEAAMVTASGMAAASSAVLTIAGQGAHVVAQKNHYGGTNTLLRDLAPRFGITTTWVDQRDAAAFEKAITADTRLIVLETPSNPVMRLTDLSAVTALARSRGILTLADNTFATPLTQRPIDFGVDLVFHSATKALGGHSDIIAGVVAGRAELIDRVWETVSILGGALAPFNGWLLLRGLRTLSVRVARQNETALQLARFLAKHPAVKDVHYPGLESHPQHELAKRQMSGFSGVLSFEPKGGADAAARFLDRVKLALLAGSLGGVETLAVHAAANFAHYLTEEEATELGITPGLIRVSVGLEAADDLIADFDQALN